MYKLPGWQKEKALEKLKERKKIRDQIAYINREYAYIKKFMDANEQERERLDKVWESYKNMSSLAKSIGICRNTLYSLNRLLDGKH